MTIDRSVLDARKKAVLDDLTASSGGKGSGGRLKMPGMETVLVFLAEKVMIPIFCSFVGRDLYDRYKDPKTKEEAAQAEQEIITLGLSNPPAVPLEEVDADLVSLLGKEGIPEKKAKEIVAAHWNWVLKQSSKKGA